MDLRQATLMFLLRDNQILLAMKKRGFGANKYNGVGGKPDPGEAIEDAAIRETFEEISVKIPKESLIHKAVLNFYFPDVPADKNWNQQVLVYLVDWEESMGDPKETEEMRPEWFDKDKIPYPKMWDDDRHWLPRVLEGEFLEGEFFFLEDKKIKEYILDKFTIKNG